ncbi:hypothetical protein M3G69_19140 [Klebsiella aerogenes]|uniref:hypothetical protein n=1 Tax=Klebsiella aerogenes TaxID=548 RepID=UPI0021A4D95F|nr:hypothetical protein [Klebsiella aerogenes]MCT1423738.1 hypothetical protein [Klebsiella aerogenes]MCT1503989.1 hypothetical protein [Klebsiella aerogenes]MCT2311162.1 hypothetical protein [Klebsiella aerogenes]MCT2320981.1 hypothetical protein [Klebsiella aerogenes]MCT2336540.1 hypothetical protein [Klebsiella aerogenes]
MITVYCQKLDSSWLTPEIYGILGVVLGASISGLVAWVIQRSNNKNTQAIESKRSSVKIYTDFFLKDIIEFIDAEVAYMQHIYVSGAKDINEFPPHQKIMYAVDTSIRMFKDDTLNEEYKNFVLQTAKVLSKVKGDDNQSALNEMIAAREMAASLKLKIYNKFS